MFNCEGTIKQVDVQSSKEIKMFSYKKPESPDEAFQKYLTFLDSWAVLFPESEKSPPVAKMFQ